LIPFCIIDIPDARHGDPSSEGGRRFLFRSVSFASARHGALWVSFTPIERGVPKRQESTRDFAQSWQQED